MAFSLPNYVDPSTGATVTYFAIVGLQLDLLNNAFTVVVNGYVSQTEYAAGKQPFPNCANMSFLVNGDLYAQFVSVGTTADLPTGTTQQQILGELISTLSVNMLTLPFFTGATII